ncbi:50S ribosomal protein L18a [Candidatus Micrarchaeota archaeon]|nr:50S ribosomal protein L18a [Candidatus Micrarchaeota archaeon]
MKFVVEGEMQFKDQIRKFTKSVDAASEKMARERVYSLIGSNNGLKRDKIRIVAVKKEA